MGHLLFELFWRPGISKRNFIKSVKLFLRYRDFLIFKMAVRHFGFCLKLIWTSAQGRRQVKKCGVDMHGELITGSGGRAPSGVQGQSPLKLKTF